MSLWRGGRPRAPPSIAWPPHIVRQHLQTSAHPRSALWLRVTLSASYTSGDGVRVIFGTVPARLLGPDRDVSPGGVCLRGSGARPGGERPREERMHSLTCFKREINQINLKYTVSTSINTYLNYMRHSSLVSHRLFEFSDAKAWSSASPSWRSALRSKASRSTSSAPSRTASKGCQFLTILNLQIKLCGFDFDMCPRAAVCSGCARLVRHGCVIVIPIMSASVPTLPHLSHVQANNGVTTSSL